MFKTEQDDREMLAFWRDRLDEDEQAALSASGATVIGSRDTGWKPSPGGDEWEASRTDCDEDELLVALRPNLPRPPDVMSGMWGAVVDFKPAYEDRNTASPLPQFQHAARHDPARVLRDVAAARARLELIEEAIGAGHDSYDLAAALLPLELAAYATHRAYKDSWRP